MYFKKRPFVKETIISENDLLKNDSFYNVKRIEEKNINLIAEKYINNVIELVIYEVNEINETFILEHGNKYYPNVTLSIEKKLNQNAKLILTYFQKGYPEVKVENYNSNEQILMETTFSNQGELFEHNELFYNGNKLQKIRTFHGKNAFVISEEYYE